MIDFLVIGGGVAGLSAGARLSTFGTVTVLEAEDATGYHASGRSAALYAEDYGPASVVALNRASASFLQAGDGYLSRRGLMLLGTRDQAKVFAMEAADMGAQIIDPSEAVARVPILNPDAVGHAAVSSAAFDIDTDRLLQGFARTIRGNGGKVLVRHRVTAIDKGKHWRVAAGECFEARILVNAAGPWVDQIAAMAGIPPIGIVPKRRSIGRVPAPGGSDTRNWPMMLGVGETWYAKPDAGKLLVSPSEAVPVEPHDAYADDLILAEGIARYEAMVTEPVTRLETSWAGLRSFAPDGTLVLGPDPADHSFVWSAGQGGYGFQTAPAASQLIADLVTGGCPDLDRETTAALSPERLRK